MRNSSNSHNYKSDDQIYRNLELILDQSGSYLDFPTKQCINFILKHQDYIQHPTTSNSSIERECKNLLKSLENEPLERSIEFYQLRENLKQLLRQCAYCP